MDDNLCNVCLTVDFSFLYLGKLLHHPRSDLQSVLYDVKDSIFLLTEIFCRGIMYNLLFVYEFPADVQVTEECYSLHLWMPTILVLLLSLSSFSFKWFIKGLPFKSENSLSLSMFLSLCR